MTAKKIIIKTSLVNFTLWTLNLKLLLCYTFYWSYNVFTLTGSSNLEVSRERSKYEILAITFCSWEEMHFVQYWGIHQKEIDTPCQVYLCTLFKENCQPCCWIIWSCIKSKVVLCWLSKNEMFHQNAFFFLTDVFVVYA